jgi:hypothetical protein
MAQTLVNFDGVPVNRAAAFLYAAQGVTFASNVGIGTNLNHQPAPAPHSAPQLAQVILGEFAGAVPLSFDFTSGQTHVAFYGCSYTLRTTGMAKAFDASRNVVAQVGPIRLTDRACQTRFDLRSTTPNIVHVEFNVFFGNTPAVDLAIDDLFFEGGQPPPSVPTDIPVITITTPANGASLDATSITVAGTVSGSGLLPSMALSTGAADFSVPLAGAGTSRTFSQSLRIPLGNVTITAKEDNTGGKQGTATISLVNLPAPLRDPTGGRGPLKNAMDLSPTCRIAVYQSSAIALERTGGAHVFTIESLVFPKWSAWARASTNPIPGGLCPTENADGAIQESTARQNFVGGRIYFDVNGAGAPFYVPKVFAEAIDVLGGEGAVGVPLSDPQSAPLAHVYLFQRFSRVGGALPTTIEIKGRSPKLWVERQGADLKSLNQAHLPLAFRTATWAEQFNCAAIYGPCDVAPVTSEPPLSNTGLAYCHGTEALKAALTGGPPVDEWVPVLGKQGNTTPTLLEGWVSDSRHAAQDWQGSHEFTHNDPITGWADWNVFVHPLDPFRNLATTTDDSIEVEFEWYPAQYFMLTLPHGLLIGGMPLPGDLYIAAGRWIIDCGHNPPASAEIHPPFATATVRTVGSEDNTFTSAAIWVNGYYRGGAPIEFFLFPPPHVAPNAVMSISRTSNAQAAFDVQVIDTFDPSFTDEDWNSFVRVRFYSEPATGRC